MTWGHLIIAVALQALVGLLTGDWWAGAALAAALFIGREVTQAEYRWIDAYGLGRRANMPWWGAFDRRVWTKLDPWLDWTVPVAAVVLIAVVLS